MDSWKYQPAKDLGLTEAQRLRSLRRETGLIGEIGRRCWWGLMRSYLAVGQRVQLHGREHMPSKLPFVMVSNHCSHLDVLVLAMAISGKLRPRVFPIAAGDFFFETPVVSIFAAKMMNALPMWRKHAGRHAMAELRSRLIEEPCGYILFPEGTRSRDGALGKFHAGLGMLVAGTNVPVVPCHIEGTFRAMPAGRILPRRAQIVLRVGEALRFDATANTREGWDDISTAVEESIRKLGRISRSAR